MVLALMPQMVFAEGDDTSELQNLLNDGGTVTLEKDYTITSSLQVDKKTVTLDLNGHVIKKNSNGSVIKVINGANLTLQDSSPKAVHTGEYVSLPAGGVITIEKHMAGNGVYVEGSSFAMNGGAIYDCFEDYGGAGVYVRNKGSFIMNNGAISSCSTGGSGGGVLVSIESSFTMNGGTISDCSAGGGCGGIEILEESSFTMNGGTISDCRGDESGAAIAFDSTIFANGGTIKDEVALYDSHIKNTATYGGTVFYGGISIFNSSNIIGKTITFKKDDNPYAIEIVAEGSKVAKPIEPTKEDYEFAGWYDENDTKYDFTQYVTQDIVLTAQWEGKEAPVIKGLEKNKTYCDAVEFEVTDNVGVASVKVGDLELSPTNGKYTLEKGIGKVEVVAKDNAGNKTSVTVTVNNGHTGGTATCTQKAKCGICGEEYGELANHSLSKTDAKDATCTEDGNVEYWTCSVCHKLFSDENGTTETTQDAVTIRANGHTLNKIDAKEATAAETGNIEYWQCDNCKKYFADEKGENEIALDKTVISKLKPEIIDGKGQSITAGEKRALSFTSIAAFDDFKRVDLDGSELSEEYYEKAEGSIIITLDADYVATLPVGEHTIGIVSEIGTATTTFTVAEKAASGTSDESDKDSKSDDEDSVKTGDNTNLALWLALMLLSGAGITGVTAFARRKRTNE